MSHHSSLTAAANAKHRRRDAELVGGDGHDDHDHDDHDDDDDDDEERLLVSAAAAAGAAGGAPGPMTTAAPTRAAATDDEASQLPRRSDSRADVESERVRIERASAHVPRLAEAASLVARRCYHSTTYGMLYAVAVGLNLVLLGWLVVLRGEPPAPNHHALFVGLEAAVTGALVVEVVASACWKGTQFFADMLNWFDLIVAVLCVSSLASVELHMGSATAETGGLEFTVFVTVLRYGAAALRLASLARLSRMKQKMPMEGHELVDFDRVAGPGRPVGVGSNGGRDAPSSALSSSPRLFEGRTLAGASPPSPPPPIHASQQQPPPPPPPEQHGPFAVPRRASSASPGLVDVGSGVGGGMDEFFPPPPPPASFVGSDDFAETEPHPSAFESASASVTRGAVPTTTGPTRRLSGSAGAFAAATPPLRHAASA